MAPRITPEENAYRLRSGSGPGNAAERRPRTSFFSIADSAHVIVRPREWAYRLVGSIVFFSLVIAIGISILYLSSKIVEAFQIHPGTFQSSGDMRVIMYSVLSCCYFVLGIYGIVVAYFVHPFVSRNWAQAPVVKIVCVGCLPLALFFILNGTVQFVYAIFFGKNVNVGVLKLIALAVSSFSLPYCFHKAASIIAFRGRRMDSTRQVVRAGGGSLVGMKRQIVISFGATILFFICFLIVPALMKWRRPFVWITYQDSTIIMVTTILFPFTFAVPFELVGRRFGEVVGTATGDMMNAVFPITLQISLLMNLSLRFILSSLPSLSGVATTVFISGVLEIFLRQTLPLQLRFLGILRGKTREQIDEYIESPTTKEYMASVILARSASEYIGIVISFMIPFLAIADPMSGTRCNVNFGQTAGVPLNVAEHAAAVCIMLISEIIVDLISFRVEIHAQGFPLEEVWNYRSGPFMRNMLCVANFSAYAWYLSFWDHSALVDCWKASIFANSSLEYFQTYNVCDHCNAADISDDSDLHFICFGSIIN